MAKELLKVLLHGWKTIESRHACVVRLSNSPFSIEDIIVGYDYIIHFYVFGYDIFGDTYMSLLVLLLYYILELWECRMWNMHKCSKTTGARWRVRTSMQGL